MSRANTPVAIIQYRVGDDDAVGTDADQLESFIREAASLGAGLVVAPEACFYRYQPWEQNGIDMLALASTDDHLPPRFAAPADALDIGLVAGTRVPSNDKERSGGRAAASEERCCQGELETTQPSAARGDNRFGRAPIRLDGPLVGDGVAEWGGRGHEHAEEWNDT